MKTLHYFIIGISLSFSPSKVSSATDVAATHRYAGNTNVILNCTIHGLDDSFRVLWWKDKQLLQTNAFYSLVGSSLQIGRLNNEQQGTYQCQAVSSSQNLWGKPIRIDLEYPYFGRALPLTTPAVSKSDVTMDCSVYDELPAESPLPLVRRVQWFYNNGTEHLKNELCETRSSSCTLLEQDGAVLHMRNVERASSGVYTCTYTNTTGHVLLTQSTELKIYSTPSFVEPWPVLLDVDQGANLSLSCEIDEPAEDYTVQWSRDGRGLAQHTRFIQEYAEIHLPGLDREDSGVYGCVVTVSLPRTTHLQRNINVTVRSTPETLRLYLYQLSQTRINVTWLPVIQDGGYPVLDYGFTYTLLDERGRALDPRQEPFFFSPDMTSTLLDSLEPNCTFQLTMWAINALGEGQRSSLQFHTYPPSALNPAISSTDAEGKAVNRGNVSPAPSLSSALTLTVVAGSTLVGAAFVLISTAVLTIGLLVLWRRHCGPQSPRARRRYRLPEDTTGDSGVSDLDLPTPEDSASSPGSQSNSHTDAHYCADLDSSTALLTPDKESRSTKSSTPIGRGVRLPTLAFENPTFLDASLSFGEEEMAGTNMAAGDWSGDSGQGTSMDDSNLRCPAAQSQLPVKVRRSESEGANISSRCMLKRPSIPAVLLEPSAGTAINVINADINAERKTQTSRQDAA